MHFWKGLFKCRNHRWQGVARLRVRGGDGELAFIATGVLVGEAFDVFRIEQHALNNHHQIAAWCGQTEQTFALAHEQLDAELIL